MANLKKKKFKNASVSISNQNLWSWYDRIPLLKIYGVSFSKPVEFILSCIKNVTNPYLSEWEKVNIVQRPVTLLKRDLSTDTLL